MVKGKPPESITIEEHSSDPAVAGWASKKRTRSASSKTENWKSIERPVDAKRSKPKVTQQQPIIVPDGKPALSLFIMGFATVFGSIGLPFALLEQGLFDDSLLYDLLVENVCCFLCNGTAIGLWIIGYYCIQYWRWKVKNDAPISAGMLYTTAGFLIIIGLISSWIWSTESYWSLIGPWGW